MKSLTKFVQEMHVNKIKRNKYKYFPKTKEELQDIIKQRIEQEGNEVDLNDINVSKITDMSQLFENTNFNGNISDWDVSNVKNMGFLFSGLSDFNDNVSNWDVSNVVDMRYMFYNCSLLTTIYVGTNWTTANATTTDMFYRLWYKPSNK